MPDDATFAEFIRRIRSGDEQAAAELVRRYESAIRMEVRLHVSDPRLYRVSDSMDICQSVMASFFLRAVAGQYDVETPGQLAGLLLSITRHKVAQQARRQRARRRDNRRVVAIEDEVHDVVDGDPSPSRVYAGRELLQELRRRLTDEERLLADLRGQGCGWAEIAERVGGTPKARCKQLARAVTRVARDLGIDEVGDE
jgi:RNA polymerase sigma factor (sigma-70 family)